MKCFMRVFVHTADHEPLTPAEKKRREDGLFIGPLDGVCAIHGQLRIGTDTDDYDDVSLTPTINGVEYTDVDFIAVEDLPEGAETITYAEFHKLTTGHTT